MRTGTRLTIIWFVLFCVSLWASDSVLQGQNSTGNSAAPNQNVEVVSLGPAPQTGGYASIAMTPDHRNFAVTGPSGSRMSGFLDGHAGDAYDRVQTVPPVLSPDGKHWAYAASKGGQSFMVVDGKEYGPYSSPFPQFNRGFPGGIPMPFEPTPRWPIVFSPDSKHFAFMAQNGSESVVVEDGKVITPANVQVDVSARLIFSKQGDHLAFVARNNGKSSANLVLDGILGPTYEAVLMPQFSDDGHHLEYVAEKAPGKYTVVVDAKEGDAFNSIGNNSGGNILISSEGSHVVYAAATNVNFETVKAGLVIDGKFILYGDRFWISPNGKYVVYLNHPVDPNGSSRTEVVINGKVGLDYAAFSDLRFAPGGRPIYSVQAANGRTFVVDNEQESEAYDSADLSTLHFSADGKHTAYVATAGGKQFVVLDGKKLTLPNEYSAIIRPPGYNAELASEKMLQFTPDGHIVYHSGRYGNPGLVKDDQVLADDGMVSPDGQRVATIKTANVGSSNATAVLTLDGKAGPTFLSITTMAFSPDSKHFAYVGSRIVQNGNDGGYFLVVDGVQKGEYAEVTDLQYSPDSQHLFHASSSHLHGGPTRNYMDQQLFFTSLWLPGANPSEWLDDHHTMQILGGKYNAAASSAADANFYRVRYFLPGADRTQDTVTSAATGAVNMQETQRLIGSGGPSVASAAATSSSPPAAAPAASAPPPTASTPSPAAAAQVAPAPGTTVEVRMIETVDSSRDPAGKRYRATVTKAVNAANNVNIPQGAIATVTLARNGTGWIAQLSSLTINGQPVTVSSSSATVSNAAQNAAAAVNNAIGGLFGRKPNISSAAQSVATGDRVILPPGATVSFVLTATP